MNNRKRTQCRLPRIITAITSFRTKYPGAIERRAERIARKGIVPEHEIPEYLEPYAPGNTYGRYRERIIRREVRTEGSPAWFDPRTHDSGHFGIVGRNGVRVYIAVEIDEQARHAPSTFDEQIATLAKARPVQDSFL